MDNSYNDNDSCGVQEERIRNSRCERIHQDIESVKTYAAETTLHGVKYIFQADRHF